MCLLTFPKQVNNILYFDCFYTLFFRIAQKQVRRPILSYGPADLFHCFSVFNASSYALFSSSKRLVMLFKPVTRVEPLCRSAPVAGGSMPPTPSAIKSALKPMMKL